MDDAAAIAADLRPIEEAAGKLRVEGLFVGAASALPKSFDLLDPAEQGHARSGTAARRHEFASGRIAAKRALLLAGHPAPLVFADDDGVPIFPSGYAGSIAHKHGRALSVVIAAPASVSVGADLEFDAIGEDEGLFADGAVDAERVQFAAIRAVDPGLRSIPTLVISVKEALYKAVFPLLRRKFGFDEAEVMFDPSKSAFVGRRFPGSDVVTVRGRYARSERWIVAVATANR
jgi:4'-phosphopantetheinyl transferase EntD